MQPFRTCICFASFLSSFWLATAVADASATSAGSPLAPTPPEQDRPASNAKSAGASPAPSGAVVDWALGFVVPSGNYEEGTSAAPLGVGLGMSLLIGGYVTPHVGVIGGVRWSGKHQGFSGCATATSDDSKCGGYTLQLPVLVQYAAIDRTHGAYVQAGLGFLTTYVAYAQIRTLHVHDPFDYKLGAGYRFGPYQTAFGTSGTLDVYSNLDFGEFTRSESGGRPGRDITRRSAHYLVELGIVAHFLL